MGKWHIGRDGQQLPAMEREELKAAVTSGEIRGSDLVWTDGMPEWKRVSDLPDLSASLPGASFAQSINTAPTGAAVAAPLGVMNYQMPQSGSVMFTNTAMQSLRGTKGWVRFIAILLFIGAGLFAIGGLFAVLGGAFGRGSGAGVFALLMLLMYAVIAGLYLMLGVYLNRYASAIAALATYRREDQLEHAIESQRKFWRLTGIMFITVFVLYFVVIAVVIVASVLR